MLNALLTRAKATPVGHALAGALSPRTKARLRRLLSERRVRADAATAAHTNQLCDLLAASLYAEARRSPRFQDPRRLLGAGRKVFSQHDEDGIIAEIFRRVGTTNRFFVEFGCGDGLENCTTHLLLDRWRGVWLDGSAANLEVIRERFAHLLADGTLAARYTFITAENIEALFAELRVPEELDFLSIDIDYNDYWIWRAIQRWSPRVVAIEYNASLGDTAACVAPYGATRIWDGTNFYGASLRALEALGAAKGYRLVGCNFTGVTSFFVRDDLVGDRFAAPFTAANHYEPARYWVRMPNGHRPSFGPWVFPTVDADATDATDAAPGAVAAGDWTPVRRDDLQPAPPGF